MTDLSARIANIPMASSAKRTTMFTSSVSATAIGALFVMLAVQLLGRI